MTIMADRAEMVLRSTHRHRLLTRSQCLRWLGSHFRVALDQTDHRTDYQVRPPLPPPSSQVCLHPRAPARLRRRSSQFAANSRA